MQGFKRLKRLYIQPEVLLGGCCGDDLAPFHLRDTLPPNLESLTFYGDEGLALNKTLSRQLQDVMASTDFPRLGHFALEMTFGCINCYTDPADPPHDEVEQACRESGRKYETKHASFCTKGGIGRRYYRHVVEKRLQMIKKLEAVRFALTEYLSRLGESTNKDGDSTADRHELSSKDLDTYELPWDELTVAVLYPEEETDSEWDYEDPFSEDEDWEEFDGHDTIRQDLDSQEGSSEDSKKDTGEYGGDSDGVW
ncbi:hypothetical protein DL769_006264 [Monosporascus sp. CRB-8-3]|nr:hypothetical protein DL769_006264 [Monosporascus sp. CRB-8-3]